jgi:hypothetical protein
MSCKSILATPAFASDRGNGTLEAGRPESLRYLAAIRGIKNAAADVCKVRAEDDHLALATDIEETSNRRCPRTQA